MIDSFFWYFLSIIFSSCRSSFSSPTPFLNILIISSSSSTPRVVDLKTLVFVSQFFVYFYFDVNTLENVVVIIYTVFVYHHILLKTLFLDTSCREGRLISGSYIIINE